MTNSVCLAIGAANYQDDQISALPGAAVDAKDFFDLATSKEYGTSVITRSDLLINPTREAVRTKVAEAASDIEVSSLTIFFAGHGIEISSGYFLTCYDTDVKKIALTGLSLTDIFQLLDERTGLHTNIVLDACEAGGVAMDLSAVTKSFEAGVAGGSSVSILAMSSRREAAEEASDGSGGFGTRALLSVMKGDIDTGRNVAELTLADVAQIIDVSEVTQTPSFWSFNIQGSSAFCRNTFALKHRSSEVYDTPAIFTEVQVKLSKLHRERLWRCYLDFNSDLDARNIFEVISDTLTDAQYAEAAPAILSGLLESFLYRSRTSNDAFAPVVLASVFLTLASETLNNPRLSEYFSEVLSDELQGALAEIAYNLESDPLFLVRGSGGYSDFITLPQRISSLAAWSLMAAKLPALTGSHSAKSSEVSRRILRALTKNYAGSFNLVSESQAPSIVVILSLGKGFCDDWVEQYIGCLYNSYFEYRGKVCRVDLPANKAFSFFKHRVNPEDANFQEFCERPSEALFALFAAFWHLGCGNVVRYDLADLDGTMLGTFIPKSYASFSERRIREGANIYLSIGVDVFTIAAMTDFFESDLMARVSAARKGLNDIDHAVATCAAMVFPDRAPWHLLSLLGSRKI